MRFPLYTERYGTLELDGPDDLVVTLTKPTSHNWRDIEGQSFGGRTARVYVGYTIQNSGRYNYYWIAECECGDLALQSQSHVRRGSLCVPCAHRKRDDTQYIDHKPISSHRLYSVYRDMVRRCYMPHEQGYEHYGGRGISVCARWMSDTIVTSTNVGVGKKALLNFLSDMGERPRGHQVDRVDVDGDYCPENCRWVTPRDNLLNRRTTRKYEYKGELVPISVLAELLDIPYKSLLYRHANDWPADLALTLPPKTQFDAARIGNKSIRQMAEENNISYSALKHRISRGWDPTDWFNPTRGQDGFQGYR